MDPRNPCDSTQGFSPSRTRGNWLHEHDKTKLSILEHQTWWERSSKERNARNQRHDKTKLSILEHQTWWEKSSKERNTRNKRHEEDEAQRTRTSNLVGEELKTKRRRYQEERKIKRLNHHGQTASTYGSLLRPERNRFPDRRMTTIFF